LRQIGSGSCALLDSWRKHYYFINFLNVSSEMQKQYYGLKRLNERNSNKMIYSQTFIKKSPLGQRNSGLIRQVTSHNRYNLNEIFYDRSRKRWPFNTGDCLIEVTTWEGFSVYNTVLMKVIPELNKMHTQSYCFVNKMKNKYHTVGIVLKLTRKNRYP